MHCALCLHGLVKKSCRARTRPFAWFAMNCAVMLCALATSTVSAASTKPHILFILVDDLGYGDVGFTRAAFNVSTAPAVQTPSIDALVADGVLLKRHYVHKMCTPTRTSVQSGRLPVHVSTSLANPEQPNCGIARNMTGMAQVLKRAGYKTHFVGKWDAGMATPKHTPHGRGYDTSLNYFEHMNDFWTSASGQTSCNGTFDLWNTDQPALDIAGEGVQTQYEEYLFRDRLSSIVRAHDASTPLLLFYAPHVAHVPLQVPADKLAQFAALTNGTDETRCSAYTPTINPQGSPCACRAQYHAMVSILDDNVANITAELKHKNMFENTLIVFSSGESSEKNTIKPTPSRSAWPGLFRNEHGAHTAAWSPAVVASCRTHLVCAQLPLFHATHPLRALARRYQPALLP